MCSETEVVHGFLGPVREEDRDAQAECERDAGEDCRWYPDSNGTASGCGAFECLGRVWLDGSCIEHRKKS